MEERTPNSHHRSNLAEYQTFFREFVRWPTATGAIAPSSKRLAEVVTSELDPRQPKLVVEFGSGTGAFTAAVASRLGSDSRFFAIEKNAAFVDIIRLRFPDLDIVHGSVETLPSLLAERGGGQVDSIISGLPWASLGPEVQHRILAVALDCLAPSGTLATFAYVHGFALPSAWKFRKLLKQHFTEVRVSRVIWFNLPPAFVYHCRK